MSRLFPGIVHASGTITGTVYLDYNMNGARNTTGTSPNYAVDSGVQGVTVTAYDASGVSVGTATTGSSGTYSLSATGTGPYRIEFTNLPSGYYPSASGTDNASTVRFVPDGNSSGIDLGITRPSDYSQNNPLVATNCYINGNNTGANDVLVALNYDRTGSVQHIALSNQIGSTWGLAWRARTKTLFAAALLKRHTGFGPGKDGTRGNADDISSIYVIDYSNPGSTGAGTVVTAQTIDLNSFSGVNVGANPRVGTTPANDLAGTTTPAHDYGVIDKVAKRGIGGIALSEDGNTLYVVNLNNSQPQLVSLNVSSLSGVTLNSTTNITNPGCPGTDTFAPWAVRVKNGEVYVGTACTADVSQNAQNLRAYVQKLSGSSFTNVDLDSTTAADYIQLYYDRACKYYSISGARCDRAEWTPWTDTFNFVVIGSQNQVTKVQPIVSDIDFDPNGAMILGLMDRTAHQHGGGNYSPTAGDTAQYEEISAGSLIKLCNVGGSYVPEGNAGCARSNSPAYDAATDPAPGAAGLPVRFFDNSSASSGDDGHAEIFFGGLATLPGANELVATMMNPQPTYYSGGWRWLSTSSGVTNAAFTLYTGSGGTTTVLGKANGLGDTVLLSDPAPLQLGNRIWTDTNGNGVQDPGENGIQNVTVQLWADTDSNGTVDTQTGQATTDSSGNYYFGGASNTNMLSSCGTTTSTFTVNASSDDAEEAAGGTMSLVSTVLDLAYNGGGTTNAVGLRFNNLTIPRGARITSATIQFTASNSDAGNTVNLTIRGESAVNSTTFTTGASNISGRSLTSGAVNWSAIGAWTAGATTNATTPNLSSIVQEIVSNTVWASGNSINFILTDNGSTSGARRRARAFDSGSAPPSLSVTYECPYAVNPSTAYEIRVPNASGGSKQAALGALNLTAANADPGTNGDVRDSDAVLSGTTAVISLTTGGYGVNSHTYDFGFTSATVSYSVGNRLWYDTNNNGLMDVTEVGISGVTVDLLDNTNAQVQTTTTNASGYYRFDNVTAGTYKVRIRSTNFGSSSTLYSYQNSTGSASATDQQDNGVDPAGNDPSTAGVLSASFTVGAAAQPTAEPDYTSSGPGAHGASGDVTDNLTVDFGFYTLTLGNLVFDDINKNGSYDSTTDVGIQGATVKLYQSDGTTIVPVGPDGILGTADDTSNPANQFVTPAGGVYQFKGLPPGSYIVKVTPPSGYQSTGDVASSASPNNGTDSDDNGVGTGTGEVSSGIITLAAGSSSNGASVSNSTGLTSNVTVDFGFSPAAPTAVKIDSIRAGSVNGDVLIEWETGFEADNLGFNVYREENGGRVRINTHLIAGSALTTNHQGALLSERRYLWWDSAAGRTSERNWRGEGGAGGASYWVESLDLGGHSEWHGPIRTSYSSSDPDVKSYKRSPLLREIGLDRGGTSGQRQRVADPVSAAGGQNSPEASGTSEDPLYIPRSTLASSSAIKLYVRQEGWYRVSRRELVAAGLSESVNPQTLQLFLGGVAVPIVVNGESDGRFDEADSIEFYGQGLDTRVTDTAVYWLVSGSTAGSRVSRVEAGAGEGQGGSFAYTVERKDRKVYFASLRNGEAENFFGPVVYTSGVEQELTVNRLDPFSGSLMMLEVSLQGVSETTHVIQVAVNGNVIGNVSFTGLDKATQSLIVDKTFVREGSNIVRLVSSGGSDVSLVDSVRLTYPHLYAADDDALRFTGQAGQTIRIAGFTSSQVKLLDVTDARAVVELHPSITRRGDSYTVVAQVAGVGQRELLAVTDGRMRQVPLLKMNEPSRWRLPARGGGADFLIVTAKEMIGAAQTLQQMRKAEGLSTAIVDIEDVYDEFSDGNKNPAALRQFLTSARTGWRHKPQYVLLLGDASYDPRNYLGYGNRDLIPSGRIDTALIETASDDWLADVDGDGEPDMSIGRLPVSTAQEAADVIGKIALYEKSEPARQVLLVSDENDDFNFEEAGAELRPLIPNPIEVAEIRRGRVGSAAAKAELLEKISQGVALVNYIGHGSATVWRGGLFNVDDARNLTNEKGLGFFIAMNCWNGYLTDPAADCLAEVLIKNPHGGAIAVWASTGFTSAVRQAPMDQDVIRRVFVPGQRLGDVTREAKGATSDQEVRRTWILFGDPTMKIRWQ
ncbi:MAG TPA: C25 family cysteine peptidase [Blastocatellia bacterium]|nr:C25 family cysteine peptidase [Blastocatellia bacterium]